MKGSAVIILIVNRSSAIIFSVALLTYSGVSLAQTRQSADNEPQVLVKLHTPAESQVITTALSIPSSVPRSPQEVLKDYESAMVGIIQHFSATVATIAHEVQVGHLSREKGEEMSGEQYQTARMQLEVLNAWHDMLVEDIAHTEATHRNGRQSQDNETVTVALPFSSLEVDPSLADYLGLSSGQIKAIQRLMSRERRNIEPLMKMKQLRSERGKLLAATDQSRTNEKEVRTRATEEASILGKLIIENSQMQAKLYRLLTGEQRRKLNDLKVAGER